MPKKYKMTKEQRLKLMSFQYKRMLEERRGHNYEYWSDKHEQMLTNGWSLYLFRVKDQCEEQAIMFEYIAKQTVEKLRAEGNYARIICGYETNVQRIKMYSVIYRLKTKRAGPIPRT